MLPSLRALLANIIDYAGMFPPAELPLDEAVRNYARYLNGPDAWMLGRFICPSAQLTELSPFVDELFRDGRPLAVSALGRGGQDAAGFLESLDADLRAISAFAHHHGDRVRVDGFEVKVPADMLTSADRDDSWALAKQVAGRISPHRLTGMAIYFEPTFGDNWKTATYAAMNLAIDYRSFGGPGGFDHRSGGFKLRCGGADANAIPGTDRIALLMTGGRFRRLRYKFTAGLHHPIRHFDRGMNAMSHGFLNLFVASVLARQGLPESEICDVVEEQNAANFVFDDDGLRWRNHRASVDSIEFVRRDVALSFGSCSFDEPRDDLRALGLL